MVGVQGLGLRFLGEVGFEEWRPDVVVPCWSISSKIGVGAMVLEFRVKNSMSE